MPRIVQLLSVAPSPRRIVRALQDRQVQAWLMVLVFVVHALVLPRIAMMPRAVVGRETEHDVRLEVAWRGRAAEEDEVRLDRGGRRSVSYCAQRAARRPTTSGRGAPGSESCPPASRAEHANRNGTGGPLRC